MSKQQYIKRYQLIINKLRRNPCTFEQLQDYLRLQSEIDDINYEISIRTFQREIKEIEINYDIAIEYDKNQRVYKITYDGNETRNERLMEAFDIVDALKISNSLSNHLILEKRRPFGTNNMNFLIHAIKNQFEVNFIHEKYWKKDQDRKLRTVQPLVLKESRYRWYLIALDIKDNRIKTFGLDRISGLDITCKKFKFPKDFNPEEKFKYSFGIITDGTKPEKIKLWLSHNQVNYIKSLPLHTSQKVISENATECVIELYMSPTYDFVMELLSIGKEVKVLEPKTLQDEMKRKLSEALNRYNED